MFVSHRLSDQATRWGVMELELFDYVFCVMNHSFYLLGKRITVSTDHNISDSTVPKLIICRVIRSEFRFQIELIPGAQNVIANGLTRILQLEYERLP